MYKSSSSIKRKLVANTVYLSINWTAVTILSFLFWFVIGKLMLPSEWGIISTFSNLMILLSSFSILGISGAVSKLIPEYLARKKISKVKTLINFSTKVIICSSSLLAIIILLFSRELKRTLNLPFYTIIILSVAVISQSIYALTSAIVRGFQNMKRIAITNTLGHFVKVFFSLILVILGFGYIGPLFGIVLATSIPFILRLDYILLNIRENQNLDKKIMMDYAFPAFITGFLWIVFNYSQNIIITVLKNTTVTGLFSLAMIATSPINIFPKIFSSALFPISSQLSIDKNGRSKQKYLIESVFKYSLFFSLPIVIFLILFSKSVIIFFSRLEYLPAYSLFPILSFASLIYGCSFVFYSTLYAIGKPKIQRNIVAVSTTTFLTFAIILTYLFSSIGMAVAYTISGIVLAILSYVYVKKELKISFPYRSISKLTVASIITFSFLYIMSRFTQNVILDFLLIVISGFLYLGVLIPIGFYNIEDIKILYFLANRAPFLRKQLISISNILSKIISKEKN